MTKERYVYRYLDENGEVVYVGKSKHLKRRADEHLRNEAWAKSEKFKIEYITLPNKTEEDLYESHYISLWQPRHNVAKTDYGTSTFCLPEKEWLDFEVKCGEDRAPDNLKTIKSFAESRGFSTQYVYHKIKTDLKPFVKKYKNKKYVDIESLNRYEAHQKYKKISIKDVDMTTATSVLLAQLMCRERQVEIKEKIIEGLNEKIKEQFDIANECIIDILEITSERRQKSLY